MKRYVKPNTDISSTKDPEIKVPLVSDISIESLINDSLTILYREVKNLMIKSVKGKLEPMDARDLRDNLKLLFELKERQDEELETLTDEQIALLKKENTNESDT